MNNCPSRPPAYLDPSVTASRVRIEWHREWSPAVAEAFAALPYDHLMDPALVRALWEDGVGRDRQKIAVVRSFQGEAVGVVPLRKRGKLSWQLLTHYVLPYARFFVRPGYTDAALDILGREMDCDNVAFYETPTRTRMLRPEESWVVTLEPTYEKLMKRTRYKKKDQQCRRYAADLSLREDHYESLPEAMARWQAKWLAEGSRATAERKEDLLLGFRVLAEQGRLKTFSLHDGKKLVSMEMNMIGSDTMYAVTTIMREEYRRNHPGIRVMLAALEWGCANGMDEYDMLSNFGHYKKQLAQPEIRGYRVIRRPFGSEALGCAIENTKEFLWSLRH